MKQVILLVAFMLSLTATAADSVNVSLISRFLVIDPAQDEDDIFTWTLEISSLTTRANREATLAPDDIPWTHTGYFHMTDDLFEETDVVQFVMDVPFLGDDNNNGLIDFYDIAASVDSVETTGIYFDPVLGQELEFFANWVRDAGQGIGIVSIFMPDRDLFFNHVFSIYQFDGAFTYDRENGTNLVGQIALTNIYDPADTISGPLTLSIRNNDALAYNPGTWTGPGDIVYSYAPEPGDNLDRVRNNYLSFLEMQDGYPYAPEADFQFWFFNVVSADANGDGVLDLVQGGGTTTRPTLQVGKGPAANQITITVSGTAGQTYELQATDHLVGGTWSNLQSVTLSSTPQTITQNTTGNLRFFQLRQ